MHRFNGDTARADCNSEDTYRKGNRAITILVILVAAISSLTLISPTILADRPHRGNMQILESVREHAALCFPRPLSCKILHHCGHSGR